MDLVIHALFYDLVFLVSGSIFFLCSVCRISMLSSLIKVYLILTEHAAANI